MNRTQGISISPIPLQNGSTMFTLNGGFVSTFKELCFSRSTVCFMPLPNYIAYLWLRAFTVTVAVSQQTFLSRQEQVLSLTLYI